MKRRLIAALLPALAVSATFGTASANRISVRQGPIEGFEVIWDNISQPLTLGGALEVECELTLLGHLDEHVIVKRINAKIGDIDHAEIENCSFPTLIQPETLPWQLRFRGFSGELPTIASIRVQSIGAGIFVDFGSPECLGITDAADPLEGDLIIVGGLISAFFVDEDLPIDVTDVGGSILCDLGGGQAIPMGRADVTALDEDILLGVRLI
jgi:hypothetical protein